MIPRADEPVLFKINNHGFFHKQGLLSRFQYGQGRHEFIVRPPLRIQSLQFIVPVRLKYPANGYMEQVHLFIFLEAAVTLPKFLNANQEQDAVKIQGLTVPKPFGEDINNVFPFLLQLFRSHGNFLY